MNLVAGDYAGVILAAGRGSRMGSLGEAYPKALLPVANEPLISHHLRMLCGLGLTEVYIVVGYRALDVVRVLGDGSQYGVTIHYLEQGAPLGSAHALGRAMPYVDKPFIMVLGDYYFSAYDPGRLIQHLNEGRSAIAAKREPNRRLIIESCELQTDGDGRVLNILEKPKMPASDLKGCGFYALQPEVFDSIARTPRTALRDEYEIMVSLDLFIKAGHPLYAEEIITWDSNFTRPEDVLECNLVWLAQQSRNELIGEDSYIEEGIQLEKAVIGNRASITGRGSLKEVVVFPDVRFEGMGPIERSLMTPKAYISCARSI